MTDYNKDVPFPSPFLPGETGQNVSDPFGVLNRKPALSRPMSQGGGGGGGGGGIPDIDVVRAVDGSLIYDGPDTLTVQGKNIVWVQMNVNVNGTAGYMLMLGSLGYTTAL